MSILYVHSGYWLSNSPSTTFVTHAVHGMASSGHPTTLIARRRIDGAPGEALVQAFGLQPLDNLDFELIDASSSTAYRPRAFRRIRTLARAGSVHKIISRDTGFLPYLYALRRSLKLPTFYESHGFMFGSPRSEKRLSLKHFLYERFFVPRLDGVICVCPSQVRMYSRRIPTNRVHLAVTGAPPAADTAREQPQPCVGYIGSFDTRKYGHDFLFSVMRQLRNESVKLLMVGGKTDSSVRNMLGRAAAHGLVDRTEVTGWLLGDQLRRQKERMGLGFVSIHGRFGSPLKVLDYLAAGIPVITREHPDVQHLLEHGKTALLIRSDEPREWASAIEALLGDRERYHAMSAACLAKARELSWKRRGELLAEL
jgi:glycosyltransferase involved in cell wall biosynthesis